MSNKKIQTKKGAALDPNLSQSRGVRRKIHSILEKLDGVPATTRPQKHRKVDSRDPGPGGPPKKVRRGGKSGPSLNANSNIPLASPDHSEQRLSRLLNEIHWTDGHSFADLLSTISEGKNCMEQLKNIAADKRSDLEQITGELKQAQTEITSLYHRALTRVNDLKKHSRTLTAFAEDLSQLGRQRDERAEALLVRLKAIDDYRRKTLDAIYDPRWEIKCHFHLFSLEHWRGNTQPSLLDIAEVLPGRLHLVSMAKCLHLNQEQNHARFKTMNHERDALRKKLEDVEKHRKLTQGALKDYAQMLEVMKKSMSPKQLAEVEPKASSVKSVAKKPRHAQAFRTGRNFRAQLLFSTGTVQRQRKRDRNIDDLFNQVNVALGINALETADDVDDSGGPTKSDGEYSNPLEDAPHRDWKTLADILGTVKTATSKRKEVWNELEDVIKCREGLKTDLHLLRDAYGNSINSTQELQIPDTPS